MKNILIIGAGKSSGALIDYLFEYSTIDKFTLTITDVNAQNLADASRNKHNLHCEIFENLNDDKLSGLVAKSALVISMLPATMHIHIAKLCLQFNKNLITPSYISPEMLQLNQQVLQADLLFLNEMGLDPGIDHMSACEMIANVQAKGGTVEHFKSHCGGLVAKESNNNPWGYKFSWNPRNVVLAGQGNGFIRWKENQRTLLLPYYRLFASAAKIKINDEEFDTYPNRDSLTFIEPYGLQQAQTVYRGTLRYTGFCEAWNCAVQLGLCDDNTLIEIAENETNLSFLLRFVPNSNEQNIELRTAEVINVDVNSAAFQKLKWLELFEEKPLPVSGAHTAAFVFQKILEEKWRLKTGDKDRVLMIHELTYSLSEKRFLEKAILDLNGDKQHTAMAKTVGLPIGIAARMILKNSFALRGVVRPVVREVFEPILSELKTLGVSFISSKKEL